MAILLGLYILQLLPSIYISQVLTDQLAKEFDQSQELEVEVSAFPSFKILFGNLDRLEFNAEQLEIDGILLTDVKAEFRAVKVDNSNDKWEIKRANNTELDFKLSQTNLYNYLRTRNEFDIFSEFKLDFLPTQGLFLAGEIKFIDTFFIQLLGEFEVANNEEIRFVVTELSVEDYRFETELIKPVRDRLTFRLDFSKLPIPLDIKQIEIKEDYLNISR